MTHEIIFNQTIEDIIFENRNKAYGAYQLRKDTDKFLKFALLIGCMFVTIISAFSLTDKHINTSISDNDFVDTTTLIVTDVDLPQAPPVQAEVVQPPVVTAQQRFAEIRTVDDAAPTDDAPQVDDLDPNIAIGVSNIQSPNTGNPIEPEPQITTGGTGIVADNKVYDFVKGSMPEFIGGNDAMLAFLKKEINYPRLAKEIGIEGKVFVEFVVNTDGSITDVKVVRGIGGGCDEEAVRAIKAMPNWLPGKQNNIAVRVKRTIPVYFKLEK